METFSVFVNCIREIATQQGVMLFRAKHQSTRRRPLNFALPNVRREHRLKQLTNWTRCVKANLVHTREPSLLVKNCECDRKNGYRWHSRPTSVTIGNLHSATNSTPDCDSWNTHTCALHQKHWSCLNFLDYAPLFWKTPCLWVMASRSLTVTPAHLKGFYWTAEH